MIREITSADTLVALHVVNDGAEGTHPITDPAYSLQMLMMSRKAGHVFLKHTHAIVDRSTNILQEAVVVTKGVLRVTVCTREGVDVEVVDVKAGECLYIVTGGFMIEVIDDATFFEFKNGPHSDDKILL